MALIVIKMEKTSPAKPSEKSAGLSSKILGKALRHNNEKVIFCHLLTTDEIIQFIIFNTLQ